MHDSTAQESTLRAIDRHVHVPRQPGVPEPALEATMKACFSSDSVSRSTGELSQRYKKRGDLPTREEVMPKILLENVKKHQGL